MPILPLENSATRLIVALHTLSSGSGYAYAGSASAGDGQRSGQRVDLARVESGVGLEREPLPHPVLVAADHLLDAVAQLRELQRRTGRAVAARTPAVRDDRDVDRDLGQRAMGDLARGQMHGARDASLCPALDAA